MRSALGLILLWMVGVNSHAQPAPVQNTKVQSAKTEPEYTPLSPEEETELNATVGSFGILIQRASNPEQKAQMLQNRALASLRIGQNILHKNKDARAAILEAKPHLMLAAKDAEQIMTMPGVSAPAKAKAYYLNGIAHLLADSKEVRPADRFMKAIELDPVSSNIGWMAMFVAEDFFEASKFSEATQWYRKYYSKFTNDQKRLSIYKLAWCSFNLQDFKGSSDLFVSLLKARPQDQLWKDARRDLAFISAKNSTEEQLIVLAQSTFPDEANRQEFLNQVFLNLEQRSQIKKGSKLLSYLYSRETVPEKRVRLYLAELISSRKQFASREHFAAYLDFKAAVQKENVNLSAKEMLNVRDLADGELQKLIQVYLDALAGRIQDPERIGSTDLSKSTLEVSRFYLEHFANSSSMPKIFEVLVELAVKEKDYNTLLSLRDAASKQESLKPSQQKIELILISACSRQNEKVKPDAGEAQQKAAVAAPSPNAAIVSDWTQSCVGLLSQFHLQNTAHEKWYAVSQELAETYLRNQKNEEAIQVADAIFNKVKNQDSFLFLQYIRFQAKKFDLILSDDRDKTFNAQASPKLAQIRKEAALQSALSAKDSNADAYAEKAKAFLQMNQDPAKAKLIRKDLFISFMKAGQPDKACAEVMALPYKERFLGEWDSEVIQCVEGYLKDANFQKVFESLDGSISTSRNPGVHKLRSLSTLALYGRLRDQDWQTLSRQDREYFLYVQSIFYPKFVAGFLRAAKTLSPTEKSIFLGSIRLEQDRWDAALSATDRQILGAMAPKVEALSSLPIEARIQAFYLPNSSFPPEKFALEFQKSVQRLQILRRDLPREVSGKPALIQGRVFQAAKNLELRVAEALRSAPVNNPEEKNQLDGLAKAYEDQAAEYDRLALKASEVVQLEQNEKSKLDLPQPKLENWPWTEVPVSIKDLIQKRKWIQAVLYLDYYQRSIFQNDQNYHSAKAGIFLSVRNSVALRRFVLNELNSKKQTSVIELWKGLAQ